MATDSSFSVVAERAAHPVAANDTIDRIAARAARGNVVLIGEASHGTQDFYTMRSELTRRLVTAHGFRAVALEADWPDTSRAHRYVTGRSDDADASAALSDFRRFPAWMWRNGPMRDFVEWLARFNRGRRDGDMAGVFGLDLYSLHASIEAVLAYLDDVDPAAAARARARYACFEYFGDNPQGYGLAVTHGAESCEDEVVAQLTDLRRQALALPLRTSHSANEAFFSAEQNARLVMNAERYYRAMYRGRESTWNLRDTHMADTLDALRERMPGASEGIVVWAHNSHLGDARATEMGRRGELNLGQLVRERHGRNAFAIGFSTFNGTVTAASDWDAPMERKRVRDALPGSYERLFHESAAGRFYVDVAGEEAGQPLAGPLLQRAIGVIYRPQTERWSHYFEADLPRQFDVMIHLDRTEALVPLDRSAGWDEGEPPETWPAAL